MTLESLSRFKDCRSNDRLPENHSPGSLVMILTVLTLHRGGTCTSSCTSSWEVFFAQSENLVKAQRRTDLCALLKLGTSHWSGRMNDERKGSNVS